MKKLLFLILLLPLAVRAEVNVTEIQELPKGCSVETAFSLDLVYKGYLFDALLYPLHDNKWIVLSHWCLDEENSIFMNDENGEEVPASLLYKDPFEGIKYPVITTDSVSFSTRNYGGTVIKMYNKPRGRIVLYKLDVECSLDVLDADPKTRRVYCRSNPGDWCWGEPQTEEEEGWKHPFRSVIGWVDEEWICSNLLSTCP